MMTILVKCYHTGCRWNVFHCERGYCSKGKLILKKERGFWAVYKCDSYEIKRQKKKGGEK